VVNWDNQSIEISVRKNNWEKKIETCLKKGLMHASGVKKKYLAKARSIPSENNKETMDLKRVLEIRKKETN